MIDTAKISGDGLIVNNSGTWLSNTHPMVIEWLGAGNTPQDEFTLEELEFNRTDNIKSEAKVRILSVMGEEQQRNSLAELLVIQTVPLVDQTIEMVTLFNSYKDAWGLIDAIRKTSNLMEVGEDVQWPI